MVDFNSVPSPSFVVDETLLERNMAIIDYVRSRSEVEIIVALKACAMWWTTKLFPDNKLRRKI